MSEPFIKGVFNPSLLIVPAYTVYLSIGDLYPSHDLGAIIVRILFMHPLAFTLSLSLFRILFSFSAIITTAVHNSDAVFWEEGRIGPNTRDSLQLYSNVTLYVVLYYDSDTLIV